MNQPVKLLDVVALLKPLPELHLNVGQVGTVAEVFSNEDFEVEFVDKQGKTIALQPLKKEDLLVLQYEFEAV